MERNVYAFERSFREYTIINLIQQRSSPGPLVKIEIDEIITNSNL